MPFLLDLVPMERARRWYLLPPTTLQFSPESVIAFWNEDAIGNPIQPLLFILNFECCTGDTEFGPGTHQKYTLQIYVRRKGGWILRNSATALIPEDRYYLSNQELCEFPNSGSGNCDPVTTVGQITPFDLESQVDEWFRNSSQVIGDKYDFTPFSLDFFGCDPPPSPCDSGPGWYATLYVRGDDFLTPLKIEELLCVEDEPSIYNLVFDEHEQLIVDWIHSGIPALLQSNYTIIDRYDSIFFLQWDLMDLITEVHLVFCPGPCGGEDFSCDGKDEGWYIFHPAINGTPLNWPHSTLPFPNESGTDGSDPDQVFIDNQGQFEASYYAWDNDPSFIGSTFQDFTVSSGLVTANWPPHGEFTFEFMFCGGSNEAPPEDWEDEVELPDGWICTVRVGVRAQSGYQDIYDLVQGDPCSDSCYFSSTFSGDYPEVEYLSGIVAQFRSSSSSYEVKLIGSDFTSTSIPADETDYLCTPAGDGCPSYSENFGAYHLETVTTLTFQSELGIVSQNIGVLSNGFELFNPWSDQVSYSYSTPPQTFLRYTFVDRDTGAISHHDVPLDLPWSVMHDGVPAPDSPPCCQYTLTPNVTISINLPARRISGGEPIAIPLTMELFSLPPIILECQPDVPDPVIDASAFVAGAGASFLLDTAFDASITFFFPLSGLIISRIVDLGVEVDVSKQCA